jgi:uncharacterized repeat protein (TIGR01451 family)
MRSRTLKVAFVFSLVVALVPGYATPAPANHEPSQSPLDPSLIDYTPIGYYGPADEAGTPAGESATIPTPGAVPTVGPNPSGKFVAYDTNVWESLALPSRHPGDNCNSLPPEQQDPGCSTADEDPDGDGPLGYAGPGGTSNVHGECPTAVDPEFALWGQCWNSQLEWLDYYEQSMETAFADLGLVVHRYPFQSPGTGSRGVYLDAAGGQAYNISATIPGADHPEETVLVSGHYDFTDSGPAAAWDSAEGHTEVMRIAYIMADYWRQTGTRPSATVKFIPWDSEESGTFGSIDYVNNNIPPGEEDQVRAYFNMDPCAGAYPAFRNGDPLSRVPEVMQLADPTNFPEGSPERLRIQSFNAKAELVVDQVFEYLDDTLTVAPGVEEPIFVADSEATPTTPSQRDEIVTAVGGLAIFTSDYANFEEVGIPIFNLFPDYFGPHADGTPASAEGIGILHTPRDNLTTINALTNLDQTGLTASEGWAKGQELCAQIEGWYMLQPEMAGTQTINSDVVAYFEALPNEAIQSQNVNFDAAGTYQYADTTNRTFQPDSALTYSWNFGDGTTGSGKTVQHAYAEIGRYTATLTVTGAGGSSDTMSIPIEVIGSNFPAPILEAIDQTDAADGDFALNWEFTATRDGFDHFRVEESPDVSVLFSDDAEDISTNWNVTPPSNPGIQPWQASDSGTAKFRGNQAHSGARSFWTGVSPPFPQPPTVVHGNSVITLKDPISVPAEGEPQLAYWSIFQNEGDDQGRVEVALDDGDPSTDPDWLAVDVIQAVNTALGQEDPAICDPSNPDTLNQGFENRRVSLARFKGKDILVRFNYLSGPENRALSQPCGWYVDDVQVSSGTWSVIGTTRGKTFDVSGRTNGTYGYRVTGIYTDGVSTAPSNIELARVTQAPSADVAVVKQGPATAQRGQNMTYTIKVTNNGPSTAEGVTMTDNLPKNAGFGSVTTDKGTCTAKPAKRLVTCNLGSMASGSVATITIVVKPTSRGNITNIASVKSTSPVDPNASNNSHSVTTAVS